MQDRHRKSDLVQELPAVDPRAVERVTTLLEQWRNGDDTAFNQVITRLYSELRRLAGSYVRDGADRSTIGPTALVHEFYLRSQALRDVEWESRGQFLAAAARAMRNLLIDNARRRLSEKHGQDRIESLSDRDPAIPQMDLDILAINEAIEKLALEYPRHARVVELMIFGGLTAEETAEATSSSQRTVERDWRFARAWLKHLMGNAAGIR